MDIQEAVKEISGEEGFYKSSTEETITESITTLVEKGLSVEDAFDIVSSVYSAGCNEYGG